MIGKISAFSFAILFFVTAQISAAATYTVDHAHSQVHFKVAN